MSTLDESHTRLKKTRLANGYYTAVAFCEKNNIPISTYNMHEAGKRRITPKVAKKYAEILNVNPVWLLTGSGAPYPELPSESETLTEHEFFNLLNYSGNPNIPFIPSEEGELNTQLYCKIFEEIARVLNEFHCSIDIKHASQYTAEIYQDIIQTSNKFDEQLAMINLAMTIFKKNIKLAGYKAKLDE